MPSWPSFDWAFQAYKSGHSLNDSLCKKLLETKDAYEIVDFSNKNNTPKFALKVDGLFNF